MLKLKIQNHDYQQTQKHFNLGCDFLVTSKDFKNIKVPQDSKSVFKIVISSIK